MKNGSTKFHNYLVLICPSCNHETDADEITAEKYLSGVNTYHDCDKCGELYYIIGYEADRGKEFEYN